MRLTTESFISKETDFPSWYLVVLLQNVVHLGHVLAGDDLDDVSLVV